MESRSIPNKYALELINAGLQSGSIKLRGPISPDPERDGKHDARYLRALYNELSGPKAAADVE